MVQLSGSILLNILLNQVSSERSYITNVTFGEYIGWYEGLNEMDLEIPRLGILKSSSSSNKNTPSVADVATMRRYSHLKLMISYMLGTGALAARYTSYGCHCLLGPDVARTQTRVQPVDDVDEVCRRQTMCMQCAKIDHGGDCQGGVKGYSFHGERDAVSGQRYIVCDNTPGTCRHSLCLCDQALADGFLKYTAEWDESNHHEWGSFNSRRKCTASKQAVSSRLSSPTTVNVDYFQQPIATTVEPERIGAEFSGVDTTDVAIESNEIILENKSGAGNAVNANVYHAEMVSPNFENNIEFLSVGKEEEEAHHGMQCCGEYPERFPYQPKTGKACCGSSTYNTNLLECCPGNTLTTIGGC